jgi:methyl-accepting chemotaxis protein
LTPALAAVASAAEPDAARRLTNQALLPLNAELGHATADLLQLQVEVAGVAYAEAEALYARLQWVAALSISAGLLFALVFGTWLVRSLRRQLGAEPGQAAAVAQAVAEGDLGVHIQVRPGDDSSLMAALQTMRDSLRQTVSGVRQRADNVATASSEIAQGNLDLSQRTEEQASALQQTAASMEQLNSTVGHNADNARQASVLAEGATAVATRGGEVVSRVVETMRGIEGSSRRIGDIIGTIDGIAFQTNILALNAAVEAARAGEQGRGFAVVAGEVRILAQRTAEAAREVKQLITDSAARVQAGTALVDEAGNTMSDVVTQVRRVTDLVAEISAASQEQSRGVAQIGEAVSQMDQVTQQNAALVEEGSAAAESLKDQANQLLLAVAAFDLGDSDEGSPSPSRPTGGRQVLALASGRSQSAAQQARQALARARTSAAQAAVPVSQASKAPLVRVAAKTAATSVLATADDAAGWQSF